MCNLSIIDIEEKLVLLDREKLWNEIDTFVRENVNEKQLGKDLD